MEPLSGNVIKYGNENVRDAPIFGITAAYETVHDIYMAKGRFISDLDVDRAARASWCSGADVADTLFPYIDPLDKEVSIDGRRFRVIGVMERKGKFLFINRDNFIAGAPGLGAEEGPALQLHRGRREAGLAGPHRDGRGAGARDPAPRAQAALLAEGQLRRLHPGHPHRPLPPDHRRHLHGDDRDLVDRPAGGRRRA